MSNEVLIIIDIQNMYFTEGNYKLYQPEVASLKAKEVLDYFRSTSKPVIHVKHKFRTNGLSEEESNFVCQIHENVAPISGETIIEKEYPSSFLGTNLYDELVKLDAKKLIIVGMMSHMCIDTTVRAAQNYGYEVVVLEDACTTKNLVTTSGEEIDANVVHNVFMASLNGMFAKIMKVDEYLIENK